MASDDPNLKSLFSRIKDCVLTELRRSPGEPQKAPCRSRDGWIGGWPNDKKTGIVGVEKPKLDDEKPMEEKRVDDEEIKEKSENVEEANRLPKGGRLIGENENNGNKSGGDGSAGELDPRGSDGMRPEMEQLPEKESSSYGTDRSKTFCLRYYIKMQNADAPICCESQPAEPAHICPPKVRKEGGQESETHEARAPTCRCAGCSSRPSGVDAEKR